MTDFAATLKAEIARLARKEIRAQLEPIKQTLTAYRSQVSSLRAEVAALEKQLKSASKALRISTPAKMVKEEERRQRFTAKGLITMRTKLGLSREKFGILIEASGQAIKNWEEEKALPREKYQLKIFALRGLGKRAVSKRLAELESTERVERGNTQ